MEEESEQKAGFYFTKIFVNELDSVLHGVQDNPFLFQEGDVFWLIISGETTATTPDGKVYIKPRFLPFSINTIPEIVKVTGTELLDSEAAKLLGSFVKTPGVFINLYVNKKVGIVKVLMHREVLASFTSLFRAIRSGTFIQGTHPDDGKAFIFHESTSLIPLTAQTALLDNRHNPFVEEGIKDMLKEFLPKVYAHILSNERFWGER